MSLNYDILLPASSLEVIAVKSEARQRRSNEEGLRKAGVTQLMGSKQALVQRTTLIKNFT